MCVSGKEQIFILIDTFFYILNLGCQELSSLVVVNAKAVLDFTTSCQDKCKLHFHSKESKGIIYLLACLGRCCFQTGITWTQLQRFSVTKARSAAFFVLLKCVAVEMRILGLLTYSRFCDREVVAIKSLMLPARVC